MFTRLVLKHAHVEWFIPSRSVRLEALQKRTTRRHHLLSPGAAIPTLFLPTETLGFRPFGLGLAPGDSGPKPYTYQFFLIRICICSKIVLEMLSRSLI